MANISSAFGKCVLKTKNIETMESLFKAFESQEGWIYGTCTMSEFKPEKVENEFVLELDFTGCGRWSYDENIKSFCKWTKDNLSEEDLKTLTDNFWSMFYDFKDEGNASVFLYEKEMELVHTPETAYENITCLEHSSEEYDRTVSRLISLGFYDNLDEFIEYEIFDKYDLHQEYDLELAFEEIGNLKELADYYNCDVDGLRKRFGGLEELFKSKKRIGK